MLKVEISPPSSSSKRKNGRDKAEAGSEPKLNPDDADEPVAIRDLEFFYFYNLGRYEDMPPAALRNTLSAIHGRRKTVRGFLAFLYRERHGQNANAGNPVGLLKFLVRQYLAAGADDSADSDGLRSAMVTVEEATAIIRAAGAWADGGAWSLQDFCEWWNHLGRASRYVQKEFLPALLVEFWEKIQLVEKDLAWAAIKWYIERRPWDCVYPDGLEYSRFPYGWAAIEKDVETAKATGNG